MGIKSARFLAEKWRSAGHGFPRGRIARRVGRGFWMVMLAAILCLGSHQFWLPPIGGFLIVSDPLQQADAVFPLAGNVQRLQAAATLIDQHYARWFVLSNSFTEQSPDLSRVHRRARAVDEGVRNSQILMPPQRVTSTYEEALALRELVVTYEWERVIIVTDPYHTRRSQMIFRDVLADTDAAVIVRPVQQHWYEAGSWWQKGHGIQTTALEYIKFVSYISGYRSTQSLEP